VSEPLGDVSRFQVVYSSNRSGFPWSWFLDAPAFAFVVPVPLEIDERVLDGVGAVEGDAGGNEAGGFAAEAHGACDQEQPIRDPQQLLRAVLTGLEDAPLLVGHLSDLLACRRVDVSSCAGANNQAMIVPRPDHYRVSGAFFISISDLRLARQRLMTTTRLRRVAQLEVGGVS
jgi:hypothetical protein